MSSKHTFVVIPKDFGHATFYRLPILSPDAYVSCYLFRFHLLGSEDRGCEDPIVFLMLIFYYSIYLYHHPPKHIIFLGALIFPQNKHFAHTSNLAGQKITLLWVPGMSIKDMCSIVSPASSLVSSTICFVFFFCCYSDTSVGQSHALTPTGSSLY